MKKAFRRNQIVVSALAVMIAVAGYLTYAGKDGAGELYPANEAVKSGDTYIAGNLTAADQNLIQDKPSTAAESTQQLSNVSSQAASASSAALESTASAAADTTSIPNSQSSAQTSPFDMSSADTSIENTDAVAQNEKDIQSLDQDMADVMKNPGEAVLASGLTVADFMAQIKLNREQVRGMNKDALLDVINSEVASSQEKQAAVDNMVKLTDVAEKENAAESLLKTKGFAESVVSIADGEADVVICQDSLTDAERAQVEDIVKRKTNIGIDHIVITLMQTNQQK
ncbi:MAG: SpoIIIAH-like family protein [Clostridiales bacterium]|nr:SpoIIIAH-like family protein [Clostridiales bacterium]